MATFITQSEAGINPSIPGLRVANNVPSNAAGNALANFGQAAIDGYKTYVKYDAHSKMNKVTEQFNADLAAAEEAGNAGEWLNDNFELLAEQNPDLISLKETLGNFQTAQQQKAGVALLYQLRAEKELKKTIRKAPGMRAEIAAIATSTLGFNPSGALVNTLTQNIAKDAEAKQGKSNAERTSELVADELVKDYGIIPKFTASGAYDMQGNMKMLTTARESRDAKENAQELFKNGQITEENMIDRTVSGMAKVYQGLMEEVIRTGNKIVPDINESEQLNVWSTQVIPAFSMLKQNLEHRFSMEMDSVPTTANGRRYLNEVKENFMRTTLGPLQQLIESEDYTALAQDLKAREVMMDKYGMDFEQSNLFMSTIRRAMPGAVPMVLQSALVTDPDAIQEFQSSVVGALKGSSIKEIKALSLESFSNTLAYDDGFNNLSRDEKILSAESNYKLVKNLLSNYDNKNLVYNDYDAIARSLAALYGTEEFQDKESRDNAIDMLRGSKIGTIIDDISEFGTDGKVKAGILADRTSEYLYTQVSRNVIADIEDQIKHPYNAAITYTFDNETGTLFAAQGKGSYRNFFDNTLAPKAAEENVARFNHTVETLYYLREYSPKLADKSKAEIAQILFSSKLKSAGVKFRGTPMKLEATVSEQNKTRSLENNMFDLTTRVREIASEI